MATSANFLSFIFLLFLIYYPQVQVQVQGRESKFFSKFSTLYTPKNNSTINTTSTPTNTNSTTTTTTTTKTNDTVKYTKQEEEPISFTSETNNGHGLYGHGSSDQFPPTTTTMNNAHDTYTDHPNQTPAQEFTGASYDEFKELNKAYSNNNNNNNNNWFETMQQAGMSDTRFIDNDMNSFSNKYPSMNVNNEQFGSSGGVNSGRYNDENASDDEFNNYMEESQMNQEELQENQEEYAP
ncbi:hypothetical protein BVC80_1183g20 [Macleaya cordata]|uniref:Uncharacterized protein n=1 Tax=Macleaya cordata TaxID=56857 RepID=A0A200PQ63_MACCD|nr:hypothetical protein BVC80_1183g20 [Macleaya cordata]